MFILSAGKAARNNVPAHSEAADGSLPTGWTFLRHVFFCTFSQRPQCAHAPIVHSVPGLKHTLWLPSFPVFLTQPVLSGIVCLHFLWCRGSGPGLCWANALPWDCTPTLALTNFSHHSCVYLVWGECSHTGHMVCVGGQRTACELALLPPCGSWEVNLGRQASQQVALMVRLSLQLPDILLKDLLLLLSEDLTLLTTSTRMFPVFLQWWLSSVLLQKTCSWVTESLEPSDQKNIVHMDFHTLLLVLESRFFKPLALPCL